MESLTPEIIETCEGCPSMSEKGCSQIVCLRDRGDSKGGKGRT